MESNIAY